MFTKDPQLKHLATRVYLQEGKTLDIGYREFPNKVTPNLYGIDIAPPSPQAIPGYVECKQVDLNTSNIPYPDAFFDNVIANDVIEHVANPLHMLCEANRVLKPGGVLVVSTPNPYYYWEAMQNLLVRFKFMRAEQEGHFMAFTRINMRTILKRTGFVLEHELGNFFTLIVLKWQFHWPRLPFLTFQISYIARKIGDPQLYTFGSVAPGAAQKFATSFAPSRS